MLKNAWYLHDTIRCTTGSTTGCIVYTQHNADEHADKGPCLNAGRTDTSVVVLWFSAPRHHFWAVSAFFLAKIVLVTSLERINERMNINVRSKTDDHCDKLAVERRSSKALLTS